MATNDKNNRSEAQGAEQPKTIGAHTDPAKIAAHHEPERLRAHTDDDDVVVPAVTADVDETPKFVKYGAAVLLGLAFGVGCYIWGGGADNDTANGKVAPHATYAYFNQQGLYDNPKLKGTIPNPFQSPFEPTLDADYNNNTAILREAAISESVEPVAPGDFAVTQPAATTASSTASDAEPVVPDAQAPVVYLFAYDSATIPENSDLTSVADQAKKTGATLDVKAYTDKHGRAAYNQRLSERRAKAVADYLIAHGVPVGKVKVHGMGATHAYANDAQDRRAEIAIVK